MTAGRQVVEVRYRPSKTLLRFHKSNAFVRAVVGPVGSGKSSGCIMEMVKRAGEQKPLKDGKRRTRFAIIRNTRPQLSDTTRKTFEQWIPELVGRWTESNFDFTLRSKGGVEAEFLFRALDKPKDVRKVLSLELTGAYLNEAREIPKEVFDGLQGRVGRYPSMADGGPTWFGVFMDTNPWPTGHWGYKLFSKERPEGFELFEQPSGFDADAENVSNLVADYYRRLAHGKDKAWVDEYIEAKYPSSDKGSIYGEALAALEARGGICAFEHPHDGVYAAFDLGVSDSTAIWWFRVTADGVDFVDHYEGHGKSLSHYFRVLRERPWQLRKVFLPHDARARTLQTGRSIQDMFHDEFGNLAVVGPGLDVEDGISALRWVLECPGTRFHTRCSAVNGDNDTDGVELLREYRYEWDDKHKVYKKTPLHNFASHTADAARYAAVVVKVLQLLQRPRPEAPKKRPNVEMRSNTVVIDDSSLFRPSRTGRTRI